MKKAFITGITGQDGYYLSKFLLENDIPCLIFVCPEYLKSSSNYYINTDELKELAKNPLITIGSHSFNHIPLKDCDDDKLEFELCDSKKFIEEIISKKVKDEQVYNEDLSEDFGIAITSGSDREGISYCEKVNQVSNDPDAQWINW